MTTSRIQFKTVDEYIEYFPDEVQNILQTVREVIKAELPNEIEETISYQIPTYKLNGTYVIYFAAYKTHISIYPASDGFDKDHPEAKEYRKGKGTYQFPLSQPLPMELIRKLVKFKLKENLERKNTYGKQ